MTNQKLQIFEDTLTSPFEHKKYHTFLKEFLNSIELIAPNIECKPFNTFSATVDHYRHIGSYTGRKNNIIALFSVCLKKGRSIETARSMQRAFVKSLIENTKYAGALVAFYTDEKPDRWRLSLVRLDYTFSDGKIGLDITPAKRYSYLVGKGEPCHTAKDRLYKLFIQDDQNPSLDELEEAFSVEAVTKDFFEQYREKYLDFKEALDKNQQFIAEASARGFDSEQFAKKLMGQIVFLYFIQKKGWLGVNAFPDTLTEKQFRNSFYKRGQKSKELVPLVYKLGSDNFYHRDDDELKLLTTDDETILSTLVNGDRWGDGPKDFMRKIFEECVNSKKNFFDDYLEPLFYTGLNQNRGENAYFPPLRCRIPFLNGGLFEEMEGYDWKNNDFSIPNELFSNVERKGRDADGILDTFERFNFTMAEDEPMEREVAIDPEMLGKVFENLLDVTDRKSKGAFYTPREIVHYMCQETLINYLATKTGIPENDIRIFIIYGEYIRDNDTTKTLKVKGKNNGKDRMEYDHEKKMKIPETIFSFENKINRLLEIDRLLENVKVVDPAAGSGAFLLGMVTEIVKARETITSYLNIDKNEYDRLWNWSLRNPYNLKRETIKNSIFACDLDPSAIDIARLRLWLSLVIDNQIYDQNKEEFGYSTKPKPLPNFDCNIICGDSLIDEFENIQLLTENNALKNECVNRQRDILDPEFNRMINNLINLQTILYDEKDHIEKESLKERINNIYNQIVEEQLAPYPNLVVKYREAILKSSKPFILWQLYFPKVFRDNGGFDIVIGNPPYIGESGHKELFRPVRATEFGKKYYLGKMDYFYFFFHKALDILKPGGFCALITTNYYLNAAGAKTLRSDFASRACIIKMLNFNELRIFRSALGQHNIITFLKKDTQGSVKCCITERKGLGNTKILHSIMHWNDPKTKYFEINSGSLYDSGGNIVFHEEDTILQKMKELRNFTFKKEEIGSGIDILQECVVEEHLKINPGLIPGKGIFAIESDEIPDLHFSENEMKVLRPYYTAEQIHKYATVGKNHKWILYCDSGISDNIEDYPHLKQHLDQYCEVMTSDNAPYGLHRPRKLLQFVGKKILSKRMTKEPCFTYTDKDTFVTRAYMTIKPSENIDLCYLVGLCNSHLFYYWLFNNGKRKGKQLQVDQAPLLDLPLYIPNKNDQALISNTVTDIILRVSEGKNYDELEKKLNEKVYKLYNLSDSEINVVESFIKVQRGEQND